MGLKMLHSPAAGTGRDHFARALMSAVSEGKLDNGLGKVGINFIHGNIKKGNFNVLRVDGVYYDHPRLGHNIPIARSITSHDLVVYQSEFSRQFAERMLNVKAKRSCVIHNGTAMNPIHSSERIPIVVASARWRANKRPRAIAEAFAIACDQMGLDAELHMAGDVDRTSTVSHPRIRYRGSMNHGDMRTLFSMARLMVHICHLDSCPNSVVECLRMGVPVLCNNIGGTKEIVGDSGMTVPIDKEFDFTPIAHMSQVGDDSVDRMKLANGIKKAYEESVPVSRDDLDIARCAERYVREIKYAMQS
jgi:glycosyltransferase involved in cell wall biosynthesis